MATMRRMCQVIVLTLLLACAAFESAGPAAAQPASGPIYVVETHGTITSVTIGYLRNALRLAEASNANLLLIRVSSAGAVLRDARPFAGELATARVPVAVYIAPSGISAGAAGVLFLSAAHVSAMAPGTSFGSPYPLARVDEALTQQTRDLVIDSATDQIRSWNADRGRNTEWVDRAVREGLVLTNQQASALNPPAIDLVAASQEELLALLDGRQVKLHDGRTAQLATLGRGVTPIAPTAWESIRLTLSNPTVAFVLLVLGALSLCLEFAAPGTTVFAGVGAVLLVTAGLGLLVLPLNWWAALLLILALGLIVAEFVAHSHGALAVTGLALLVMGALNLIDSQQAPGVMIAVWVVLLVGLILATLVALGVWLALRSRDQPAATGQQAMIGRLAEVRRRLDPDGMVFVEGALWQAISENGTAEIGDWVRVTAVHDLRLVVRPLGADAPEEVAS
jgi:membrane-bound serine protease (ClpP class)